MAGYKVEICGVNTSTLPLLKNEEKEALFERVMKGDKDVREKYIHCNLRLVLSIVQRFSNNSENLDDLFQVGCIGLIKAIDNFDPTLGLKFSTYAVPMIIGEIRRYLRDNTNPVRVSRALKDTAYKAIYAKEKLSKEKQNEPTMMEISKEIGISKEEIVAALDAIQMPVSLYEPVYSEGKDTLYVCDQVMDKKCSEEKWVEDIVLNYALDNLDEKERQIIKLRFYEAKTQMEVAKEMNISQAQVSRLENCALKNMRKYLGNE